MLRNALTQNVYYADSGSSESGMPPVDAQVPYVCVYSVPGGETWGPPLTAPQADGQMLFQVNSVGGTSQQAVWMDDQVRTVILDRNSTGSFTTPLAVGGMSVIDRASQDGTSGPQEAVIDRQGRQLWQTTPRFSITVTPA